MAELADAIDSKSIVLRTSPFESGQGHHAVKKLLYLARNKEIGSLPSYSGPDRLLKYPGFLPINSHGLYDLELALFIN